MLQKVIATRIMLLRRPFRYTFFNATFIIAFINLAVFLLTFLFPRLKLFLSMSFAGMKYHMYWQPLSYMYVHANVRHILFNMIALICFGWAVERSIGSIEFILFYHLTGILDGIISIVLYRFLGINVFLMGASGAVYALLFAYAVIFPNSKVYIWGLIPVPSPLLVAGYAVIEIVSEIAGGSNVAHLTHLAGFGLAWIYFVVRMGVHPLKVWRNNR